MASQDKIDQLLAAFKDKTREEILHGFHASGCLWAASNAIRSMHDCMALTARWVQEITNPENDPFSSLLAMQAQRLKRYLMGLSRLSWEQEGKYCFHAIDSYYAVLKATFEVVVEFNLLLAFRSDHGDQEGWASGLRERIHTYAHVRRAHHNQVFRYVKPSVAPVDIPGMSNVFNEWLEADAAEEQKRLRSFVKDYFDGAQVRDVNHWFPLTRGNGAQYAKGRPGSMQWQCVSVLGAVDEQFPWPAYYHGLYELLNRVSHAQLGYLECFRSDVERQFDLACVLADMAVLLDVRFLRLLSTEFTIPERNIELHTAFDSTAEKMREFLALATPWRILLTSRAAEA